MVWFISGNRNDLTLAISDSGTPICHGEGRHEPKPHGLDDVGSNIDYEALRQIQHSKCAWTITRPDEADIHIDGGGEGLLEQVRNAPNRSDGMIKFFAESPILVGFTMVVPEITFERIRQLFELVLHSDSLDYGITVDFLGFRVPLATVDVPTWDEFIAGRPYFFNLLSVAVNAR